MGLDLILLSETARLLPTGIECPMKNNTCGYSVLAIGFSFIVALHRWSRLEMPSVVV
jgi:hypothetical protein